MNDQIENRTYSKDLTVLNKVGFHLRVAKTISEAARRFESEIYLSKDGLTANAKSVLGLTSIFAPKGTIITCSAKGPDAREAVLTIERLFENKFGEE